MFEPDCISKGIRADKEGDFETAIHYYEMSVNSRCTAQRPFDRLISIYRAHKMWDNLVRILRLVVDVYLEENEKMLKRSLVAENKLKYYKEIKEPRSQYSVLGLAFIKTGNVPL